MTITVTIVRHGKEMANERDESEILCMKGRSLAWEAFSKAGTRM